MKTILFLGLLLVNLACTKNETLDDHFVPAPFNFVLTDKFGEPLIKNQDQKIWLGYVINGDHKLINDVKIKPIISSEKYKYYASTLSAPLLSVKKNIKQFYLQLDQDRTSPIYLDVIKTADRKGTKYKEVKFNGQVLEPDFNHNLELYILKKE